MKNLKKILMALLLVALMVSAVATVAIAEASYTGSVAEAKLLLNEAIAAADSDIAKAKAEPLKKLYEYLLTVNPEEEGYDEVKESYNQMTFKVTHYIYEKVEVKECDTLEKKQAIAAAIADVHAHIAVAPVIRGESEEVVYSEGFECERCGRYRDFTPEEYYNGITDEIMCPGTCTRAEQKLKYTADEEKTYSYLKFEEELNDVTLAFAGDITAYLYGLSDKKFAGTATYYEVREARKAVLDYLETVKREEFKAPVSSVYPGDINTVTEMLKNVGEDSSFEELKTALADVYNSLIAAPVNPTSDEFAAFLINYNDLGELLIRKLKAAVDGCESVDEKIAAIADFRDYLNGTEEAEGTQISEKVVRLFNEYRADFINGYRNADSSVAGLKPIEASVPEAITYKSDFTAFTEKLDSAELPEITKEEKDALIPVLYGFVSDGVLDPTAEAYASAIERYVSVCVSYVKDEYVDKYYAAETISEELSILNAFLAFIKETPLCEEVTDMYAELLFNMIGRAKAIIDVIDLEKLPEYEETEKVITSVSEVLVSLLGKIDSAYAEYETAAEADKKAAALENAKTALVKLGAYIEGNGINTVSNSDFVDKYNETRQKLATALLEAVSAAEADKKEEALAGVKAYFAEAPVLKASVVRYNKLVAEFVTDENKKQELTLSNVYIYASALIEEICKEDATLDSMLENGKKLAECEKGYVDVTDEAYTDYVSACDGAYRKIAARIDSVLPGELEKANSEECVEIIEGYIAYADELNNSIIIDGVNKTLEEEREKTVSHVQELEKDPYRTESEKFLAEIEIFDNADTRADKMAAFKTVFTKYNSSEFMTTERMIAKSFEAVKSGYERVYGEIEAEILSYIDSFADPNLLVEALHEVQKYVTAVPFSEKVIGAYKAECEMLAGINFSDSADKLEEKCDAAEHKIPADFSGYLARVNLALEMAKEEGGVNGHFAVAYNILFGKAGVEGPDYAPKPIYFGVEALGETLNELGEVKTRFENEIKDSFENDSIDDKKATLKKLEEFIKEYPYSKAIHELYYDSCEAFVSNYRKVASAKAEAFEPLVNLLHAFIEGCPVNTKILGAVEKSRYQTICELAEISQLVMAEEAIDAFWELPDAGEFSLIHENLAADTIRGYVDGYGLTDTNDSKIAFAAMKFAFEEFIIKFTEEIKDLDEETKAREIAYRGGTFVLDKFPKDFIELYESEFGLDGLEAVSYSGEKTDGDVVEILSKMEAVKLSEDSSAIAKALAEVVSYVNPLNLSTGSVLGVIEENFNTIISDIEQKTKEQIAFLETKSKVEEQSYPVLYDYDHETSGGFTGTVSGTGSPTHVLVSDGTNKYAQMTRHASDSNCFRAVTIKDLPDGIVIEMDLMSPGELSFNIYENNVIQYLFEFKDGALKQEFTKYKEGDPLIKVVPGQWTHVMAVVDCDAQTVEMFVDYVSLGTKQMKGTDRFKGLRVVCDMETGADVSVNCYDNIKIYSGTAYRTLGKIMTTEEQFNNSVTAMFDTTLSKVARARAYYIALSLVDLVGPQSDELKAKFKDFDPTLLKKEGSEEALSAIIELAAKLDIEKMTTDDISANEETVARIKSQIELNRQVLDQTDETLLAISKEIIEVGEKNIWLSNLLIAIDHLGRFHRATTVASITKHYNLFKTYFDLCELDKPENMAIAESDPACAKFAKSIESDASVIEILEKEAAGKVTFNSYCSVYILARMSIHNNAENSQKIIDCVGFIKTVAAEESTFESAEAYYAELVAQAEQNYDYVETYLSIIRGLIKAEAYNENEEEFPGISKAVEIFRVLDARFSEILKTEHYGIIKEKLERYNETSSYIEKAGICTFLENFIFENNVDLSDEEGARYLATIAVCKNELSIYMEDYEAVLVANTEAFIATVEKMKTYVTYKELKPLYDEAINEYYYSMNVDSDEVRAAVETFTKYQEMIKEWENSSAMFIGYVANLRSARRQAQKFRALVNCMSCIDGISEEVEGVTEALKTYSEALSAYNADIAPVNSEISEANDVVCSLRTHSISATILAIIQSMMNK